jgi:subtilisin family serine protease
VAGIIGAAGGTVADELKCLAYVLDQRAKGVPVRVVNASFGSPSPSRFEEEAIAKLGDAGIMVSAAAGNDAGELGVSANSNYPAQYGLLNIISVAASDARDRLAGFSNYGFYPVDVAAPGVDILSSYPNAAYRPLSGTSMAAPQVGGAHWPC